MIARSREANTAPSECPSSTCARTSIEASASESDVIALLPDESGANGLQLEYPAASNFEPTRWRFRGGWLRTLGGYLTSATLHAVALLVLASWLLNEAPRHGEPAGYLSVASADEAASVELFTSAPAASPAGSATQEPMIFDVETPLTMTGPKLATGWVKSSGITHGSGFDATAKAGGNSPRGQEINFFGSKATGQKFVFVLDASGSMNDGERFARAARELLQSMEGLTEEHQFCVLAFNDQAWPMMHLRLDQVTLIPATQDNKDRLRLWLASLRPIGWTDPRDALSVALHLSPSAIFLLSDGEFKQGPPERKLGYSTMSDVNKANRTHIPIHTLAFEDQSNAVILRGMARASGGTYRFVPPEPKKTSRGQR